MYCYYLTTLTTYIAAVCCYRPSSVVCLSICWSACHTSEPCKNGWTDRHTVWVEDSGGPREPCIRWGSRSPHGKRQFWGGKWHPIVKYRDTLWSSIERCLNLSRCRLGWGLGKSREPCIRWGPDTPSERQFLGKEEPIVSIGTFCRKLCKNGQTNGFAVWIVDSGGSKEAQVQSYSPGGAIVPTCEGTLAPPGEYDWTVRLQQRCSFMSNYFDHLFITDTNTVAVGSRQRCCRCTEP